MAIQNFDKLNTIGLVEIPEDRKRSEPYADYFGVMELRPDQMEEREEVARLIEEPIRDYLLLLLVGVATGMAMYAVAADELANKIVALGIAGEKYARNLGDMLNDSTQRNEGDDWTWSEDRVTYISENEANTICNERDFLEAVERGMAHKQWIGIGDKRERDTHFVLNDLTIPIMDYFKIGSAVGLFPKDVDSAYTTLPEHPEELIGCRCSIRYLP